MVRGPCSHVCWLSAYMPLNRDLLVLLVVTVGHSQGEKGVTRSLFSFGRLCHCFSERKSSSFQEEKCDMKRILDWRRGEVMFLKRKKRQVDSLLRLCRKVKHLVQGTAPRSRTGHP